MNKTELQELQGAIASVKQQDVHLGRVLDLFATHLAGAHKLEYPVVVKEETPQVASTEKGDKNAK